MEPGPQRAQGLVTRWSTPADATDLAELHAAAWRYAYSGVIPEPGLSRMIARRGPGWWRRLHDARGRALVAALGGGAGPGLVGYALIGRCRSGPGGEIQELYVRPEAQGLGFGSRLFAAAQGALAARGVAPLTVWCLEANRIGIAFYEARGGRLTGRARERIAGADLAKLRFVWS